MKLRFISTLAFSFATKAYVIDLIERIRLLDNKWFEVDNEFIITKLQESVDNSYMGLCTWNCNHIIEEWKDGEAYRVIVLKVLDQTESTFRLVSSTLNSCMKDQFKIIK